MIGNLCASDIILKRQCHQNICLLRRNSIHNVVCVCVCSPFGLWFHWQIKQPTINKRLVILAATYDCVVQFFHVLIHTFLSFWEILIMFMEFSTKWLILLTPPIWLLQKIHVRFSTFSLPFVVVPIVIHIVLTVLRWMGGFVSIKYC